MKSESVTASASRRGRGGGGGGGEAAAAQTVSFLRAPQAVAAKKDFELRNLVRRPLRPFQAAVLAVMYRWNVCSCHEMLRRHGRCG
eukprot:COSAG01_NODE_14933_length_1394_cov_1.044015_2_plen_86_part_00